MTRLLRRLVALVVLVIAAGWLGTAGYVATHADPDPMPQAAAIVVLSGGDTAAGGLAPDTALRVAQGVRLWQAGAAPVLVMSGGTLPEGATVRVADRMAAAAEAAGVPPDAILAEAGSHSTLQNAILTADLFPPASGPVILVTHRFHLPRGWFNFRMQGFDVAALSAADSGPVRIDGWLLAEGPKWVVNLARAGLHAGLSAAGVDRTAYMTWLD
ncbi:MAG: YdcF family protein [Rhodobacteraceae bacterium]|jgi:uncharacterized SAM-binding protein YcdF (DUF218 family)|nr:YdcF family protein [Paracoccaceae bacterium]